MSLIAAPLPGAPKYALPLATNWRWVLLSGVGLFITYLGFNLLYANFGASSYILYTVLSIVTKVLVVGLLIFKESLNSYYWAAMLCALVTVVLFTLSNKQM